MDPETATTANLNVNAAVVLSDSEYESNMENVNVPEKQIEEQQPVKEQQTEHVEEQNDDAQAGNADTNATDDAYEPKEEKQENQENAKENESNDIKVDIVSANEEQKEEEKQTDSTNAVEPPKDNGDESKDGIDRKKLWKVLNETQCPLMPSKYDKDGEVHGMFYFNDNFWTKDGEDSCKIVEFKNEDKKRKVKDDSELILAVDRFTDNVSINKSSQIYHKLQIAYQETKGFDDGDDENDVYKKLIPNWNSRVVFMLTLLSTLLNAYFIADSIVEAVDGTEYDSVIENVLAFLVAFSETILFANLLCGFILVYSVAFLYKKCKNQRTDLETKTIAIKLRSLSALSLLVYMPSTEIIIQFAGSWREKVGIFFSEFVTVCRTTVRSKKTTCTDVINAIFAVPVYIIESIAPFIALYAVLTKMQQLDFVYAKDLFDGEWDIFDWLDFAAFLNQVGGLRIISNIEAQTIQHFVFSGSDATLDADELLLLDDWWNVSVLSAVANLRFNWYDSLVFWYSLNPRTIQLLLKHHRNSDELGDSKTLYQFIKDNDIVLEDYDKMVMAKMKENEQ